MRGDGDVQMRKLHVDITRNHEPEHRGSKNTLLTADTPHPAARGAPPPRVHRPIQRGGVGRRCLVASLNRQVARGHTAVSQGQALSTQDACIFEVTLPLGGTPSRRECTFVGCHPCCEEQAKRRTAYWRSDNRLS